MKKQDYINYAEARAGKSPCLKNCFFAFVTGGAICCLGQALTDCYIYLGAQADTAKGMTSVTLIFIAGLLTGCGVFDRIAHIAGAGTLVPITGFSNAVASPAIDSKSEGFVLGVGAKMFVIAGPVIVYGTVASVVYGIIYYLVGLI